jgi:pyruvate, orthophosphate dikinase
MSTRSPSSLTKYTYFFGSHPTGENLTEGQADMKALLGGKGANLAEMARLGLPVPPGFTISTEACLLYYQSSEKLPPGLQDETLQRIATLEEILDRKFGSAEKPLLLSVRSGARASMPGMMDTILNLGLNDASVLGLAKNSDNPRFAWDCYRRFIQMYADVVLNIHVSQFEFLLEDMKSLRRVHRDEDLSADDLKELVSKYKRKVLEEISRPFPQDPHEQLWGAIGAVFHSWNGDRAVHYRKMEAIPNDWGTAVNIQTMVFGNMGEDSGTGVAFTRDPSSGERRLFGEYLTNAQGEDVVSGIRTPQPLTLEQKNRMNDSEKMISLEEKMPAIYEEFLKHQALLEKHYRDMQDLEFTIEKGRLFMLQTRNGKRTTQAAVRTAVDMVNEGLITKKEAVLRINPYALDQLLHPRLDPKKKGTPITKGLPASPGAVSGKVAFSSTQAEAFKAAGEKAILVRHETSPEDIQGMDAAAGILTALGGMTSHAAVVARGMGKSCVVGCADLRIRYKDRLFEIPTSDGVLVVKEGESITLDANSGEVFHGIIPTVTSELNQDFEILMGWADEFRSLRVRANADTPHDARIARQFGAEGIGLCRTEHMFFESDRIDAVRSMILSETQAERERALESILPMQRSDFIGIFREMKGLPVTIRLLDPPLHEFIPKSTSEIEALAQKLGVSADRLENKSRSLHEYNPMLGHRGCRLGVSFPEIYDMQARAIAEAMVEATKSTREPVQGEIMIPLIMEHKELSMLRERIERVVYGILDKAGLSKHVLIGTMIEIPRAALLADQVAQSADFFSFGTNDLTQMTLGISRDDSNRFLPEYVDLGLLAEDPFMSLDQAGVGQLVRYGVERGRSTKADLKTGVCGEHGGDPRSIEFFHNVGLDYVSCSPFRVPTARLSAAQASLKQASKNS